MEELERLRAERAKQKDFRGDFRVAHYFGLEFGFGFDDRVCPRRFEDMDQVRVSSSSTA